jgi:hypothetical protein
MARFFAVAEAPDLGEARFRDALGTMSKWRFDRHAWVVKAYCIPETSTVYVECEAPDRSRVETWLRDRGWEVREIHEIDLVFEAGAIWQLKRHAAA